MRLALLAIALLILTGCSTTQLPSTQDRYITQSQPEDYFQVRIAMRDGKELSATVYQPELEPGDEAPVIIATHGFGGFRAKRPLSIYGKAMLTGEAALAAWKAGYWVVFYDQRGWGGSQGRVHMMDPEYEVADLSEVIDWTLDRLPGIKRQENGEPALGMIGESYGAGLQTLAAFTDPRLQAIVPLAGWHDLNSIAPNGEFRTGWGAVLLGAGGISSGFDIGEMFAKPWRSGFSGTLSEDAKALMYQRSPARYCDAGAAPHADALFIQGFTDTIFPFQQAQKNYRCWQEQGRDARLIGLQGAHVLPWPIQEWRGFLPFFQTDDQLNCGDYQGNTVKAVLSWWDEKLRDGQSSLPDYCLNVDDHRGVALSPGDMDTSGDTFRIDNSRVSLPLAGAFEWLMVGVDTGTDLLRAMWPGADRRQLKPNGGIGRPKFIPVYVARRDDELLLGSPEIELRLGGTSSGKAMPIFVGVGVQHANRRRVRVASEQLTPLPTKGIHQQDLPALAQPLDAGDRVGLVVYGFTSQFPLNSALLFRNAHFQGSLTLPLTRDEAVSLKAASKTWQ